MISKIKELVEQIASLQEEGRQLLLGAGHDLYLDAQTKVISTPWRLITKGAYQGLQIQNDAGAWETPLGNDSVLFHVHRGGGVVAATVTTAFGPEEHFFQTWLLDAKSETFS